MRVDELCYLETFETRNFGKHIFHFINTSINLKNNNNNNNKHPNKQNTKNGANLSNILLNYNSGTL